ncbi:PP2C family protein-serine/threonine phosphatase [Falsihalocynthiibacter sp. SS001]|uniref:PP2C family protein-serine/threonine phosphatase n=1 Tax=Falsihalocynthiibacter sp. SS001 TaxID=3349698 RepID=UPI0036D31837
MGAIKRILVVDDSRAQRRLLSKMLARWGYGVLEAESGEQAIESVKSNKVDLILSDWMMPGMSGVEFCRHFRQMERDQYGYFILLTSKSAKEEIAHGLEVGADDFLTKPVASNELRARIMAADRILRMERELIEKNELVSRTLEEISELYNNLDRDLVEAKKLQQSLVKERFRSFDGAQVSLLLRPSGHVGGDLVGMFPINDTQVGLFAIDVSGHGITSALMTARLAGYLSGASPKQNVALKQSEQGEYIARSPAEAAEHLNRLCLEEMDTENYFTLILASCDLRTGEIRLTQAGHPHPVIQRANGAIEYIGNGGLPVGLFEDAKYEECQSTLGAGDRLIIVSDGITECPNLRDELLDEEGLGKILKRNRGLKGSAMMEALVWDLQEYAGEQEFPDDISAAMVEFVASK